MRPDFVLVLSAPLDVGASGQPHRLRHDLARLVHEAANIAPPDVQEHGDHEQPVLAGDHAGSADLAELRDLSKRHLRAARTRDEHAGQRLRARAVLRGIPDPHGEPLAPFDGQGEIGLPDRRLDDVLNGAHRDAIARCRLAIDLDVEVRGARDLLGIHIRGAGNLPQHLGHRPGALLECGQVVTEDLHAHLGADACRQHVDPVDDRLGPDIRDAGHRRCRVQLANDPLAGHPPTPLILGLQVHHGLGHVDRRRVRRGVRPRDLRDHGGDLRHRPDRRVLLPGDLDRLGKRDRGIRDWHEHQVALVERRHELPADPRDEGKRAHQDQQGGSESEDSVT